MARTISTAPGRRRDATANRAALLAAAQTVLARDPHASLDAIAQSAGLSRRALYGHFSDRESLLREVIAIGAGRFNTIAEATDDPRAVARDIRAAGAKAGLSVKPGTPIEPYLEILKDFDTLLVMSVEPGFGGQKFIAEVLPKVTAVRRLVDSGELTLVVEIDGGINDDTIEAAAAAGVDCFVAGSAVYNAADPGAAVESLRRQAAAASPHLVL